jgi:hypothetical protein
MMDELDERDPIIRKKLRYCPKVMADLLAGTFVLVSTGNDDLLVICCIVDCFEKQANNGAGEPSTTMKVNVFRVLCDDFPLENVREVVDPTIRFVPEVVQTSEFISVAPTEIKYIAFVFKTDVLSLAPHYHAVQGISNVFQLRYCWSHISPSNIWQAAPYY